MKLVLGEGSNATLFLDEKEGSDDENSDEEDEDADFESVANLQYLRLGEFWDIPSLSLTYLAPISGPCSRNVRQRGVRIRR